MGRKGGHAQFENRLPPSVLFEIQGWASPHAPLSPAMQPKPSCRPTHIVFLGGMQRWKFGSSIGFARRWPSRPTLFSCPAACLLYPLRIEERLPWIGSKRGPAKGTNITSLGRPGGVSILADFYAWSWGGLSLNRVLCGGCFGFRKDCAGVEEDSGFLGRAFLWRGSRAHVSRLHVLSGRQRALEPNYG